MVVVVVHGSMWTLIVRSCQRFSLIGRNRAKSTVRKTAIYVKKKRSFCPDDDDEKCFKSCDDDDGDDDEHSSCLLSLSILIMKRRRFWSLCITSEKKFKKKNKFKKRRRRPQCIHWLQLIITILIKQNEPNFIKNSCLTHCEKSTIVFLWKNTVKCDIVTAMLNTHTHKKWKKDYSIKSRARLLWYFP